MPACVAQDGRVVVGQVSDARDADGSVVLPPVRDGRRPSVASALSGSGPGTAPDSDASSLAPPPSPGLAALAKTTSHLVAGCASPGVPAATGRRFSLGAGRKKQAPASPAARLISGPVAFTHVSHVGADEMDGGFVAERAVRAGECEGVAVLSSSL